MPLFPIMPCQRVGFVSPEKAVRFFSLDLSQCPGSIRVWCEGVCVDFGRRGMNGGEYGILAGTVVGKQYMSRKNVKEVRELLGMPISVRRNLS